MGPVDFLSLPPLDRRAILELGAGSTSWTPTVLEKDAWVVWCLHSLFSQPDAPDYAFKGGTSLSKVYGVIDRFSEDVDITVSTAHDHMLGADTNVLSGDLSNTRRRRLNEVAAERLSKFLRAHLVPYLEDLASGLPELCRPTFSSDGANVRARYPSALTPGRQPPYVRHEVLLEFGSRGTTEPREKRTVVTYLDAANVTESLAFPVAQVMVMVVGRTFWEKATLIHAEITRSEQAPRARYARHWFDLYAMASNPSIGPAALDDRDMLDLVIDIKSKQFRGGGVRYEACSRGGLRLMPEGRLQQYLREDFGRMREAGVFLTDPPSFDVIVAFLRELEQAINARATF